MYKDVELVLQIKGEKELYNRLNRLNRAMQTTFWGFVRQDLEDTLLKNVKPHTSGHDSKLERNVYAKTIDDGAEAGIRNDGMLVSWNGLRINYAKFVNGGTSDHDITPKNKKALRFVGAGGRNFFSKGHRVSGIKASHFIENTAKETFGRLDKLFKDALKKDNVL